MEENHSTKHLRTKKQNLRPTTKRMSQMSLLLRKPPVPFGTDVLHHILHYIQRLEIEYNIDEI